MREIPEKLERVEWEYSVYIVSTHVFKKKFKRTFVGVSKAAMI